MPTTPVSKLRQLKHVLRTPLTLLELHLDRAHAANQSTENRTQLQQIIEMAQIQRQRIEKYLQDAEDTMPEYPTYPEYTPMALTGRNNMITPLCYFPITTILIDDNEQFLEEMQDALFEKKLLIKSYQSPDEAFIALQRHPRVAELKSTWLRPLITDELNIQTYPSQLDISSILHLIEDQKRFSRTSVIVIDYHMDGQDGLTFCQRLSGQPFKKILMTGDDDYPRAVAAFNAGLIDRFILKGQAQFTDKLALMIQELEHASFIEISLSAYECLLANQIITWSDPVYCAFIQNWITQQNLQEYYWLDSRGSLLGITAEGHFIACIVRTEEELHEFELIAREQKGSTELIDLLHQRKKMVVLLTPEEHHFPVNEWSTRLYPIECLQGREPYYYAVLRQDSLRILFPTDCPQNGAVK